MLPAQGSPQAQDLLVGVGFAAFVPTIVSCSAGGKGRGRKSNGKLPGCDRLLASWTAGWRHNSVHAQILDHLPVVVKGMNQRLDGE